MKILLPAAVAALALALATPALAQPPHHGQLPGAHAYPHARMGHPHWSRGDRLDRAYRGQGYYVTDWRMRHLRRPPRGYRWVRVNDQYLLVAITTGIILDAILMSTQNQ